MSTSQAFFPIGTSSYAQSYGVMAEAKTPEERLTRMFRHTTCRPPNESELGLLRKTLARYQRTYRENRPAASKLLAVGESPRASGIDPVELAAYTAVANTVLNLDEVITKE